MATDSYTLWCLEHGCDHAHCPWDCEHPQPFLFNGGLYCGKCWWDDGWLTPMVPCTPETCA